MKKLQFCLQLSGFLNSNTLERLLKKLDDYIDFLKKIGDLQGYNTFDLLEENEHFRDEYVGKKKSAIIAYEKIQIVFNHAGYTKTAMKKYDEDTCIKNICEVSKLLLGLVRNSKTLFKSEKTIDFRISEIAGVRRSVEQLQKQLSLFLNEKFEVEISQTKNKKELTKVS